MAGGHRPALSFRGLVGLVAGFLFGVGVTVFAVLIVTGEITFMNSAGEPTTDITRILLGLLFGALGLTMAGAAIAGFPQGPHSSSGRADRESGFDSDADPDDFD
ncbi:hypothetical protein ACFQ05_21950 [Amycolatopsis umgeniensis]|uniref:Uncharacterized protein n=1 Tax=Amycolatopsis umgeniensis TaxID=336628 RepID=A0A841BE55_9PSEU|nr:hypothetical protein [Amycolatopsis umgeniensis]MBB5858286.1 hypothetical protein [Amycolatopsis umgeniensis]